MTDIVSYDAKTEADKPASKKTEKSNNQDVVYIAIDDFSFFQNNAIVVFKADEKINEKDLPKEVFDDLIQREIIKGY